MPAGTLLPMSSLPAAGGAQKLPFNVWKYMFFGLAIVVLLLQTVLFFGDIHFSSGSVSNSGRSGGGGAVTTFNFGNPRSGDPAGYGVSSKNAPAVQMGIGNAWVETIATEPRIFVIHNLATPEQCQHLIELGKQKGMERAKILPYGQKDLVESTTRTNTGAWLDFQQDSVVTAIENKIAELTKTTPRQGENMQILHYEPGQQFQVHHDFFDPETDPPENFNPGGNRMCTVVLYLHAAEVGGETWFQTPDLSVLPKVGDAVLFYDMNPDGSVDRNTMHAGKPPVRGEKWVMSKWIHERPYQRPVGSAVTEDVA